MRSHGNTMKSNFLGLKAVQFRQKAERCRELAANFSDPRAKLELIAAGKGWTELADRQEASDREENAKNPPPR